MAHTKGPWGLTREGYISSKDGVIAIIETGRGLPWESNGKLIAAAPELLAALKAIVDWSRQSDPCFFESDLCTDAIAAIDKAESI